MPLSKGNRNSKPSFPPLPEPIKFQLRQLKAEMQAQSGARIMGVQQQESNVAQHHSNRLSTLQDQWGQLIDQATATYGKEQVSKFLESLN